MQKKPVEFSMESMFQEFLKHQRRDSSTSPMYDLLGYEQKQAKTLPGDIEQIRMILRKKNAGTIFLGGKVSGPHGEWREEVKQDLKDAGHEPIDPKKKNWDPTKDIYKEVEQMLTADHVVFHKGGVFTNREKKLLDAVGKDYTVVKDPQEVIEKFALIQNNIADLGGFGSIKQLSEEGQETLKILLRNNKPLHTDNPIPAMKDPAQAFINKHASEEKDHRDWKHQAVHTGLVATGAHVGLNATLMAKDKFLPQMGDASRRSAVLHALHGHELRPSVHEGLGLLAGFETVGADYDIAHNLTKKVMDHVGGDRHKAVAFMNEAGDHDLAKFLGDKHHMFRNIRQTLQSVKAEDLEGFKPNKFLTAESAKIDPRKASIARKAVGAAALAAGAVINPDLAVGPAINKVRQVVGGTKGGQDAVRQMMAKGITNGPSTPGKKLMTSLAMSPAVGEIRDMGAALGDQIRRLPGGQELAHVAAGKLNNLEEGKQFIERAKGLVDHPMLDPVKSLYQDSKPIVGAAKDIATHPIVGHAAGLYTEGKKLMEHVHGLKDNPIVQFMGKMKKANMNPYQSFMEKEALNRYEGMVARGLAPMEAVEKLAPYMKTLHPQSPLQKNVLDLVDGGRLSHSGETIMEPLWDKHLRIGRRQMRMGTPENAPLTQRHLRINDLKAESETRKIDSARGSLERLFRQR